MSYIAQCSDGSTLITVGSEPFNNLPADDQTLIANSTTFLYGNQNLDVNQSSSAMLYPSSGIGVILFSGALLILEPYDDDYPRAIHPSASWMANTEYDLRDYDSTSPLSPLVLDIGAVIALIGTTNCILNIVPTEPINVGQPLLLDALQRY